MWKRYLKPRCANLVMHDAETRTVQAVLDTISTEDKLVPQTMAHIKHLVGGMFHFAIAQGHLPRGTINPVTFGDRSHSRFRRASLLARRNRPDALGSAGEPSRTVVRTCRLYGVAGGRGSRLNLGSLHAGRRELTRNDSRAPVCVARANRRTQELALEGARASHFRNSKLSSSGIGKRVGIRHRVPSSLTARARLSTSTAFTVAR
jgi:hypothetical protein